MNKRMALRKEIKAKRSALDLESCFSGSAVICEMLKSMGQVQEAKSIMAYLAMPREVNLDAFITYALEAGKKVYVPRCTQVMGIMEACELTDINDVEIGAYQIRAPKENSLTALPEEIDCIIVPGVAFDEEGGRLGMGGGFYDRFLQDYDERRCIGVCWELQIVPDGVPMEPHDCRVKTIVTEKRTILRP